VGRSHARRHPLVRPRCGLQSAARLERRLFSTAPSAARGATAAVPARRKKQSSVVSRARPRPHPQPPWPRRRAPPKAAHASGRATREALAPTRPPRPSPPLTQPQWPRDDGAVLRGGWPCGGGLHQRRGSGHGPDQGQRDKGKGQGDTGAARTEGKTAPACIRQSRGRRVRAHPAVKYTHPKAGRSRRGAHPAETNAPNYRSVPPASALGARTGELPPLVPRNGGHCQWRWSCFSAPPPAHPTSGRATRAR